MSGLAWEKCSSSVHLFGFRPSGLFRTGVVGCSPAKKQDAKLRLETHKMARSLRNFCSCSTGSAKGPLAPAPGANVLLNSDEEFNSRRSLKDNRRAWGRWFEIDTAVAPVSIAPASRRSEHHGEMDPCCRSTVSRVLGSIKNVQTTSSTRRMACDVRPEKASHKTRFVLGSHLSKLLDASSVVGAPGLEPGTR